MIKVIIKDSGRSLLIKGHAKYDVAGKDIVCAAVSTMAITTINAILSLEEDTIAYKEDSGLLEIRIVKDTEVNTKLISNLVEMLEELRLKYPKNIEIRNED